MTVETVAAPAAVQGPWYRSLTRQQWNVLVATNLGWLFDGFETYALILTAGPALRQLLDPSLHGRFRSISAPLSVLICWAGASAACSAASRPTISAASAS